MCLETRLYILIVMLQVLISIDYDELPSATSIAWIM